jgi:S1-C subfamily serine protease
MMSAPMRFAITTGLLTALPLLTSLAQQTGVPSLPEDLPKTAVLIEKARTRMIQKYVPSGVSLPPHLPFPSNVTVDTNLYARMAVEETVYDPCGSGVLLDYSGLTFVATANHVVSPEGNVYFRIAQKDNKSEPRHASLIKELGLDWVRDTNADLAVTAIHLLESQDDVKTVPLETFSAAFAEVKVGDQVFVLGFPSSVVTVSNPAVHFVRDGIVASKFNNPEIVLDAFLFPGNSGGPVFWKPASGIHLGTGLKGKDIPGRQPKLVGIASGTLPYREEAQSLRTGRTRVIFEENSGLAKVISSDALLKLMRDEKIVSLIRAVQKAKGADSSGTSAKPK